MAEKMLILECAGLDMTVVGASRRLEEGLGLEFAPVTPVFPAVTCVEQATMRTGLLPAEHGVTANGRFDRASCRVEFWGQSAGLCRGRRIWEDFPERKVGVLFMQQSLGDRGVLYVFSPAPIHRHHGGMIMACHAKPPELEAHFAGVSGGQFDLSRYWGPLASGRSSEWIASATLEMMRSYAPDILFSYLPHMDYCLQREGPRSPYLGTEADFLASLLERILAGAKETGYEVVIWGDYAITEANLPVFPNRALRSAGLFVARDVRGRLYPNLFDSRAFALVDHQVAHIHVREASDVPAARRVLEGLEGVDSVRTAEEAGFREADAGALVLTAKPGAWFAYPWWESSREAPDYAGHVDIHNKIGFDPNELFWGIPFLTTSSDPRRVHGTHGRIDTPAAYAVTSGLERLKGLHTINELASNLIR